MATTIFLVNPQTFPIATSYLLDTYTAAAAYSLRQLKTGVTSVVRVRRSSDNAESDFSASDITDGTLATWATGTDGFVVTLYNQGTGGGSDMTQSTAADQGQIVSSGSVITKGGLPCVQFDGSTDHLSASSFSVLESYPFSVVGVGSNEGNTSNNNPLFSQRLPTGNLSGVIMTLDRRANAVGFLVDEGATNNTFNYTSTLNDSNQRLQTFTVDGSGNGELWLNGISNDSIPTMGVFATTPNTTAYISRSISVYGQTNFQEVIIFNSDESANRTDIESDINTYYSIY